MLDKRRGVPLLGSMNQRVAKTEYADPVRDRSEERFGQCHRHAPYDTAQGGVGGRGEQLIQTEPGIWALVRCRVLKTNWRL